MLTGNKGEWSEIYTFLKLLADGKLHAADADLQVIEDIYYPLVKILRAENNDLREYIYDRNIKIINGDAGEVLLEVPVSEFQRYTAILYENIIGSKKVTTFSIPEVQEFMENIHCKTLKARSTDKTDIRIVVHDLNTGLKPTLGFSIKSKLGQPSTLLNASKSTNFIYRIIGEITEEQIEHVNSIKTKSKVRDRLLYLEETGCHLEFYDISRDIFKLNMQLVDSLLPQIMSYAVQYYYQGEAGKMTDLVHLLKERNPCNFNHSHNHNFYAYKIKNLLTDIALGMVPATIWTGQYDATGGTIIVREDGEVVCYHIYNRNEYQDYLIQNTKLETASTNKWGFGSVYKQNGNAFINLNLQIRYL